MKSWIEDILVVVIILAGLSFLGFALYEDLTNVIVEGDGEVVAVLSEKENRVQRNARESQMWQPIRSGSVIYNYDTIRTDSSASAQVKIFSKDEEGNLIQNDPLIVNLGSNVMVTIVANETNTLDVAVHDLKEGRNPKTTRLQMENGEVTIGQDGESVNIEVIKGSGQIMGRTEVIRLLKENETASVDKDGRLIFGNRPITLLTPEDKTLRAFKGSPVSIDFKWELDQSGSDTGSFFQISGDRKFNDFIVDQNVDSGVYTTGLEEGVYYWRVVKGDAVSPVRKIFIQRENRLELVTPSKTAVTYFEDIPQIFFRWRGAEMAKSYLLSVYEGNSSSEPVFSTTVNSNSYLWQPKNEGLYRWRIEPQREEGDLEESVSGETYFTLKHLTQPPQPVPVSPELGETLFVGHQLNNLTFLWRGSEAFNQYALQVASDSGFTQIVADLTTDKTQALVNADWQPGETYYWRVLAEGNVEGRNLREKSTVATFSFEKKAEELTKKESESLPTPSFRAPVNGGYVYLDEVPFIDFKWKDLGKDVKYKLSIYNTATNDPVFVAEGLEEASFRFDKIKKLSRDRFYAEIEASRYIEATNSNLVSDTSRVDFTVTLRYIPKAPQILEGGE